MCLFFKKIYETDGYIRVKRQNRKHQIHHECWVTRQTKISLKSSFKNIKEFEVKKKTNWKVADFYSRVKMYASHPERRQRRKKKVPDPLGNMDTNLSNKPWSDKTNS